MNLLSNKGTNGVGRNERCRQHGSAVLVALIFLCILEVLIMTNARTLYQLKQELRLIEKRQQVKFNHPSGTTSNQPPARLPLRGTRP